MKLISLTVTNILFSVLAIGSGSSQIPPALAGDPSLREFLPKFEEGINRFINGDPTLWKENVSRRDDITLMGGWGGLEKGWNQAGANYDWAAARFKESGATLTIEYVSSYMSGDLAYTVSIERSKVRVSGQEKPASMALRVTHILRREGDTWKLVHRHADPLIDKTAAATVLQGSK